MRRGWTWGALALLSALCAGAPALAQEESAPRRLVEVESPDPLMGESVHRKDCRGAFCAWHVHQALGPCSTDYCANDALVITDREGRVLWEPDPRQDSIINRTTKDVRFIAERTLQVLDFMPPFHGRGYDSIAPAQDVGVDQSYVSRGVFRLSQDGRKVTRDLKAARLPAWMVSPRAPRPPPAPALPAGPRLLSPVPEASLAKAREICGDDHTVPLHHECHGDTCTLLVTRAGTDEGNCDGFVCPVVLKNGQVRSLAVDQDLSVFEEVTSTEYVFTSCDGPYGSRGSRVSFSRLRPDVMAFTPTQGLHVNGAEPYPVRQAATIKAARALAPTAHADTRIHIPWGSDAWRDERDLALAWQVMRVGEALWLHAKVDDDVVVPFTQNAAGRDSDHLELSVSPGSATFKLGVLLEPGGKLQVRRWQKWVETAMKEEDEAFDGAEGSWRRNRGGYEVDLRLPLTAVRAPQSPLRTGLSVFVSDADQAGKQETLMGHQGTLYFWSEYPPSVEEYRRAH
ncbi:sugar-binding protein [Corallococcus coralloides]|nr:sugar-binding protein [Corallococcus coralloides]